MRVDYYHTGNDKEERFSLDRIVIEPLPWPGNAAKPIDDTNRGKYFFEVVDTASGRTLYSRGFASIYGEWETTAEAKSMNRTFSESLRFPAVDRPAQVVVKKRDPKNAFQEIWTFAVDPADKFIERGARMPAAGSIIKIHEAGDPAEKLDLLVLGDGYTASERGKFERDARRLVGALFQVSPFKERQKDINVWGLVPAAVQSGISRPSQGIHRRSPLGTTYDAFGSERYVLTFENRAFRDHRVERAVRRGGDPDQFGDLRRRRDLRAVQHRRRRQRVGAVCVHPRVRAPPGRPGRRVLHVGRGLPSCGRSTGTLGAQCDGAARSVVAQMARSRRAGHSAADAVAQGGVRNAFERHPGTAASDPRLEQA